MKTNFLGTASRFINTAPFMLAAEGGADGGGDPPAGGDKPEGDSASILYGDDKGAKDGDKPAGEEGDGKKPDGEKPAEWKEFVPDAAKTEAENAAAKAEHDKTKPAAADPLDIVPADGKYALTMPEGVKVDQELLDALGPQFAAKKMTGREAQSLADAFVKVQQDRAAKQNDAWSATVTKWVDDAKADKEIGGDNWKGTVGAATRAVNTLGTPALKEYLEATGGGNHPELIRFMSKVGALIKEDSPASGDAPGKVTADRAETLYPDDKPKGN